jgi:hypothetical protein
MLMRVVERQDAVRIELTGITGRQESVLAALTECQRSCSADGSAMASLSVRARTDRMHVCLRPSAGQKLDVAEIYRYLRRALIERGSDMLARGAT